MNQRTNKTNVENKHPSILLIIPYFGKFNNYFPFFLESCRNNPTVNWLIVTDDKTDYNYPENVKVVFTTFAELRDKIQGLFDFKISLERPYKFCDFRPAYGLIFSEYTKGYDFWGHCDSDQIFGDIRSFLTDDILEKHDKVLSRGHLSLYRNCEKMNKFFLTGTDGFYQTVFTTDRGFSFDEWGPVGVANHLKKKLPESKFWDGFPFDDLHQLRSDFFPAQKKGADYRYIIYRYHDGRLDRLFLTSKNGDEVSCQPVLYAHFQKRPLEVETDTVSEFLIVPDKIIPITGVTPPIIKKLGAKKLINKQYLRIKFKNLKRKIRTKLGR